MPSLLAEFRVKIDGEGVGSRRAPLSMHTEVWHWGIKMRFSFFLALLAGLSVAASAQQHHKQAPRSTEQKERTKAAPVMKGPTSHNSTSLELSRLEQATAKSAGGQKSAGRQHVAVVKTEREKSNPPIRFGSAASGQASGGKAGSAKSRVRQKGRH